MYVTMLYTMYVSNLVRKSSYAYNPIFLVIASGHSTRKQSNIASRTCIPSTHHTHTHTHALRGTEWHTESTFTATVLLDATACQYS